MLITEIKDMSIYCRGGKNIKYSKAHIGDAI